jgi:hypothetical protein
MDSIFSHIGAEEKNLLYRGGIEKKTFQLALKAALILLKMALFFSRSSLAYLR